jgi:acyl-CoA synthetase (AMP-forming)/AMP-acid ligase II
VSDLVEVERVVARWPGVARVTVRGDLRTAYVVRSGERDVAAGDILAHCRLYLPPDEVPARVEFVDDLPR